jgi:hypothetical protein
MDFDPRWNDDPHDDDHRNDLRKEESGRELNQGSRGVSSDPLERDARDPRDVFTRDLDLPRGPNRERVWFREHSVLLRGSESRALATTGAFRVVHPDDLRDSRGQAYDPRSGELRHLREEKLVRTIPVRDGRALVVLTERGRHVLERNRHEREQHFYPGLQRPRELLHDAKVYQAYEREAERLREDGAVIHRVMLDTELKRGYQQFLQEHNRGKSDSDGRAAQPDVAVACPDALAVGAARQIEVAREHIPRFEPLAAARVAQPATAASAEFAIAIVAIARVIIPTRIEIHRHLRLEMLVSARGENHREMLHAAVSSQFRRRFANKRLQSHHLGAVWV